jgi:hypothetical protein
MNSIKNVVNFMAVLIFVSGCAAMMPQAQDNNAQTAVSMQQQAIESWLNELQAGFSQVSLPPNEALARTAKAFNATHDQRAWDMLVTQYLLGHNQKALQLLKHHPDPGFALAIVEAKQFSRQQKQAAVEKVCDPAVYRAFLSGEFVSPKTMKSIKKKCPQL